MASTKNEPLSLPQAFGFLLLLVCIILLIAPRQEVARQIQDEADSIASFYGERTYNNVYKAAEGWYSNSVVKTGIREKSLSAMSLNNTIGSDETLSGTLTFLNSIVVTADEYIQGRIELIFDMYWWLLMRFSMLLHWLPLWLPILICACYNGLCEKNIKLLSFGYANPSLLKVFGRTIAIAVFSAFVAIAIPWAIPPIAIPVIFGVIVAGAGFMICNFQWRF